MTELLNNVVSLEAYRKKGSLNASRVSSLRIATQPERALIHAEDLFRARAVTPQGGLTTIEPGEPVPGSLDEAEGSVPPVRVFVLSDYRDSKPTELHPQRGVHIPSLDAVFDPDRIFVNGTPYEEAIERLRASEFPQDEYYTELMVLKAAQAIIDLQAATAAERHEAYTRLIEEKLDLADGLGHTGAENFGALFRGQVEELSRRVFGKKRTTEIFAEYHKQRTERLIGAVPGSLDPIVQERAVRVRNNDFRLLRFPKATSPQLV